MTEAPSNNEKDIHEPDGHWIRYGLDEPFLPVTKDQYILAERDNGFNAPAGQRATASFHARDVTGTTLKPNNIETAREISTDSIYQNRSGKPVTFEEWEEEIRQHRLFREDAITLDGSVIYLRTQYIGVVIEHMEGARLFGTIVTDSSPAATLNILAELETYETITAAYIGHLAHREAITQRYHCRVCKAEGRTDSASYPNG